jgi:hypothetical protein
MRNLNRYIYIISFDMIHEYALENLCRRTTGRSYETPRLGDKTTITCATGNSYFG